MPVRSKPQVPGRRSSASASCSRFGQHRDVARHLGEAVVLHQHRSQLLQRKLLVLAVHRRARVDDVAQARVVVTVHARILDQHLQDRRHGEQVRQAVLLDQRKGRLGVELVRRHQHRLAAAGDHVQLVNAGPMRQGRQHQRAIVLGRARHQVAQVVGDDEAHLPVRQHRGLRSPGRARGEEQPAGAVPLHRGVRHRAPGLGIDQRAGAWRVALRPRFAGKPDALDVPEWRGSPLSAYSGKSVWHRKTRGWVTSAM